jgi:nitrosocyanin
VDETPDAPIRTRRPFPMSQNTARRAVFAALAAVLVSAPFAAARSEDAKPASVREITLLNIKYQGKILWLPNPLVVKKGETVKLTLLNNVPDDPSVHGFSIPEFGVKADVEREKPLVIEFKAARAGLFETNCHLHPAHLKGQILVLDR